MALLIMIYPFAEIYAFVKFIEAYSFLDALAFVMLSGFLGMMIMTTQGKATFSSLQAELGQGKTPGNQVLHRAVVMFGGFLIFLPGIISDVFGVLCVLPGTRHLIVRYLQSMLAKGASGPGGRFGIFVSGFGRPQNQEGFRSSPFETRVERDAQVIDVDPIEITHTNQKPSDSEN